MDLINLAEKLRDSGDNLLEYYKEGKKEIVPFKEVYHDVIKVCNFFKSKGVLARSRVIILGKNSYDWIVIDLACILSGIITIPLEIGKTYELEELFEEFESDLLLTNLSEINELGHENVMAFDEVINLSNLITDDFVPYQYQPDEVFTFIFTSGTQGKSKFIEVKKKSFDYLISESQGLYNFTINDRFLVFLPLSIYLERVYVYSAILLGFSVIVTPLELVFHSIQNDKPSIIIGVPYFFETFRNKFLERIKSKILYSIVLQCYLILKSMGFGLLFGHKFAPFVKAWGGNIRYLITGSAPITKATLLFYKKMGIILYEGYGMSEIGGMIALNSPGKVKLGSVGKPFPGKEVVISEIGEILVRSDKMANDHYYKIPKEESDKTYIEPNCVATGDIGYFDKDGFLFINGRIKDIIVLSSGKKIHPGGLEELLIETGLIANALVYGDNKPNLVAIIVPKTSDVTQDEIRVALKKVNETLASDERILNVFFYDQHFTIQNKMLTNSLKLNRRSIVQQLQNEIEELY